MNLGQFLKRSSMSRSVYANRNLPTWRFSTLPTGFTTSCLPVTSTMTLLDSSMRTRSGRCTEAAQGERPYYSAPYTSKIQRATTATLGRRLHVEAGFADRFRGLDGRTRPEHRQPRERRSFVVGQEPDTPVNRLAERLLARGEVASPAGQQGQSFFQTR